MEFRLLGPVEAHADGRPVDVGSRKQRLLLAMLLMTPNQPVPSSRLAEVMWPDERPESYRAVIHSLVYRLRRSLCAARSERWRVAIATLDSGYLIRTDPMRVDAARFRAMLHRAAACESDLGRVEILRAALDLWRGPALSNAADDETRTRLCAGLNEARMAAVEDHVEARLRLGRHREVLAELTELVGAHPARERLAAQLMLALHRSGQTSRACEVYERTRRSLAEEYGLDPGPALRGAHQAILCADPSVDPHTVAPVARAVPRWVVPAQLPADIGAFTGRAAQLAALDSRLAERGHAAAPAICVITGEAGVGKSALAVHWARARRSRFPDGQVVVNLRGQDPEPLTPAAALGQVLAALLPTEPPPPRLTERVALYRSLLAGKRVMVVCDDAADAEQVRPLLPGGPGCCVVVTSRRPLGGLVAREGARRITLGPLAPAEAVELMARLMARLLGHPVDLASVAEVARLCGYLPRALSDVATHLADQRDPDVAGYLRRLRGEDPEAGGRAADVGDRTGSATVTTTSAPSTEPAAASRVGRLTCCLT